VALEQNLARHRLVRQAQDTAFEQEMARQRLVQQDRMLRFHYERTYLTAQLQAARLGLTLSPRRQRPLLRFLRRLRSLAATVGRYAGRGLRRHPPARGL